MCKSTLLTTSSCRSPKVDFPEIRWSNHAKQRLLERFGPNPKVTEPTGLIQLIGAQKQVGERFRVRVGKFVLICGREEDCILIITVAQYDPGYRPPKGKPRKK